MFSQKMAQVVFIIKAEDTKTVQVFFIFIQLEKIRGGRRSIESEQKLSEVVRQSFANCTFERLQVFLSSWFTYIEEVGQRHIKRYRGRLNEISELAILSCARVSGLSGSNLTKKSNCLRCLVVIDLGFF